MNKLIPGNSIFLKSSASYVIAMVVCALIISFIDSLFPQGVSIGEAYAVLVLIGLVAKDSKMIIVGAIVGTVLTLEGLYISEHGVALWITWTNRALSIFIIWAVAVIALAQVRLLEEQKESEKMKKAFGQKQITMKAVFFWILLKTRKKNPLLLPLFRRPV